jgi:Zn-dependent peptidase ImmA (M78 family)/transcriptional regulator with XRE-family HTH domain
MAEAIPVNSNILKWARETSGLSLDDVSRKIRKPADTILKWEQGLSSPSYSQLEKLAYEVYKRPTAVFFFPDIPQESSPRAEFRTLPDEVVDTMPPEIIRVYKRAKVYQLNLKDLDALRMVHTQEPAYAGEPRDRVVDYRNGVTGQRFLDTFKLSRDADVVGLSKAVRTFLKIDLQTQVLWKNLDAAIESWRNILIACGIYVFKDAFYNDQYSGLSLYDEGYPVILINNTMPGSRQIFTIFHELGHLLFKAGGIDLLQESFCNRLHDDYYIIEQKCNEFAGEFLFPLIEFQSVHDAFSENTVSDLADRYKVSRELVLRKYLNEKLISQETYRHFADKWLKEYLDGRSRKKGETANGNAYNTKKSYLGAYYINLAFSHYYQGRINIETLADYLGLKAGNVPAFEGYVLR